MSDRSMQNPFVFKLFDEQDPVFLPGPTNIPHVLRQAMNIQTCDHRSSGFQEMLGTVLANLRIVFGTVDGEAMIFPASGTAGWEAGITNLLSPGDTVLIANYGYFSERWISFCHRTSLNVRLASGVWGDGIPYPDFESALREDKEHKIKAVIVTHNETATGVISSIPRLRQLLDDAGHPALMFVDCVSSLACVDFQMDNWGVDLAVSGSQKGFMLTSGLSVLAVSKKALDQCKANEITPGYFDFSEMIAANRQGLYPYTPPVGLINGMRVSLELLLEEGLRNVFARHRRVAEGVRKAVVAWEMTLVANDPEQYSDTVSAIHVPCGIDSDVLVSHLKRRYGVSIGRGLGRLSGRVFRIGHLGAVTDTMMLAGLAVMEMALADLGHPVRLGAGVAAAQEHYCQQTSVRKY